MHLGVPRARPPRFGRFAAATPETPDFAIWRRFRRRRCPLTSRASTPVRAVARASVRRAPVNCPVQRPQLSGTSETAAPISNRVSRTNFRWPAQLRHRRRVWEIRSADRLVGCTLNSTDRSSARDEKRSINPGAACSAKALDAAMRSSRRPWAASVTSIAVCCCRPRISTARLANRSPPGVNASPAPVLVNKASSSSLRSAATCIETPASDMPNSSAAARTEPNRTTAE